MKKTTLLILIAALAATPFSASAAAKKKSRPRRPQTVGPAINENKATPISRIKAAPGFKVELVYSVPGSNQGSWVNLGLDDKGRIIASDQFGGLYRFPLPAPGKKLDPKLVKKDRKSVV